MRIAVLLVLLLLSSACLANDAAGVSTNAVLKVVSTCSVSNSPALKHPRPQCEAITKSGTRCKRNAIPGEKLCRQHLKSAFLKKSKSKGDVGVAK